MPNNYIRKKCRNCGYTERARIYGYVQDPIGMPVSVCPMCRSFYREYGSREWIQMGPVRKYLAICPRADAFAFFASLVLDVVTMGLYLWVIQALNIRTENHPLLASFPIRMLLWNFLLLHYLFTFCSANRDKFLNRLVQSIRRTRNPEYRKVLESLGELHSEDLPGILPLTAGSRAKLAAMLAEKPAEETIYYPSMFDSIKNI